MHGKFSPLAALSFTVYWTKAVAHIVIVSKKELLIRTDWFVSSGRLEKASCKPRKLKSSLCLFSLLLYMFCMTHSVYRLSAASSMLWKRVCFPQTTKFRCANQKKTRTNSLVLCSVISFVFERLCPPLMEGAVWFSQDAETSLQPPGEVWAWCLSVQLIQMNYDGNLRVITTGHGCLCSG